MKSNWVLSVVTALMVCNVAFANGGRVEPINEVFSPAPRDPRLWDLVAVVQSAPSQDAEVGITPERAMLLKRRNWAELEVYVREAAGKGAKLVITSEFGTIGYPNIPELPPEEDEFRTPEEIAPYVETVPGPTTEYFSKISRDLGIYLHVGLAEVDPVTKKFYNTVAVMGPQGEFITKYRKMNLYMQENDFLSAGEDVVHYDSPWGRIGVVICADIYSRSPLLELKRASTDVIALSTSWAQYNTGMRIFQRAARDYTMYVLAANQPYFPDSGVIDPNGLLQSHIRQTDGVAYGYLPKVSADPMERSKERTKKL